MSPAIPKDSFSSFFRMMELLVSDCSADKSFDRNLLTKLSPFARLGTSLFRLQSAICYKVFVLTVFEMRFFLMMLSSNSLSICRMLGNSSKFFVNRGFVPPIKMPSLLVLYVLRMMSTSLSNTVIYGYMSLVDSKGDMMDCKLYTISLLVTPFYLHTTGESAKMSRCSFNIMISHNLKMRHTLCLPISV